MKELHTVAVRLLVLCLLGCFVLVYFENTAHFSLEAILFCLLHLFHDPKIYKRQLPSNRTRISSEA